jgi:formylglycine-generating enzyme required for sulfatase activity
MKKSMIFIVASALVLTAASSYAGRGIRVRARKSAQAEMTLKTSYYALLIGNDDYQHLPRLKTAISDVTAVAGVLATKYGFKTKVLTNATRYDILTAINDYRKKLGDKDSFLVYYAGHGEYDKTAGKGYWLPVDAERDNPADWIMAEDVTSNIKRIEARHVLVIADSCYSGTLMRSAHTDLGLQNQRGLFLQKMMARESRTLMASGGNEPVADAGGRGNHSVFASAFLTALNDPDRSVFTAEELFLGRVKVIVAGRSDQLPRYSSIRNSGDEGGDFVFQLARADQEEDTAGYAGSYEAPVASVDEGGEEPETRTYTDPATGMEFVFVKGGCYRMGDTFGDGYQDERPVHRVCVDDFYIGKYEVTQDQWQAVMGDNPSQFKRCGGNCPVESVSWNDVQGFIEHLNNQSGGNYRLPTEAEWEYAARSGGRREKYSGGNDIDGAAWYGKNSSGRTHTVGWKQPNGLGIYDMTGNVWEWCSDWYGDSSYSKSPEDNPKGPSGGAYRVLRGGSWSSDASLARSTLRNRDNPAFRNYYDGFRLVRTAD